jgi:predicted alpha/beta superfamily hydrolase
MHISGNFSGSIYNFILSLIHSETNKPGIMKKNVFILLLTFSLFFILQTLSVCSAQDHPIISDSIYSGILKEERSIKILLPDTYKAGSADKYEVIYITDGEWAMDPFSFVYKFAKGENFVPPAIIVAVPNKYTNKANQRDRDFLPVHVSQPAISGGAANFLSFFKDELIPYIDKTYPSNGTNSLYGHSYGGIFVLYALLSEPKLFGTYYATDPPFGYNDDYLIKMAAQKLENLPPDKILWLAGNDLTYKGQGIDRLDSVLRIKAPANLHWKMVTYPNETHNSVRLKAMYDGIKFSNSGYSNSSVSFHPMNGILLKDKPTLIGVSNSSVELWYTTDGTEPDITSKKVVNSMFTITGPAQLVLKAISINGKYDKTVRGNFELGEALPSVSQPKKIEQGGLKYSYYEGSWEKLPDFKKLKPIQTGLADSLFNINKLPGKTNFACLFEGYIEILKDGYYIFATVSNDGSKLYLGDKLIIDNDGVHSTESVKSFVLPLKKGFYPIRLEYFQKDESSSLQLLYLIPDTQNPTTIPFNYQYHMK